MKGYIEVKESNRTRIDDIIDNVQKRASARCISFDFITDIIKDVERRCSINKKDMAGTEVRFDYGMKFPSSYYKHGAKPSSTHFNLLFDKGTCYIEIDSIRRSDCPNSGKKYELKLSDLAKEAVLKQYT